jgi:MFS family permease
MNKWRVILVTLIVLAFIVLVGTELIFERPLSWLPGREFLSQRHRVFLERAGIEDLGRRMLVLFATLLSSFFIGCLVLYAMPKRVKYIANSISLKPSQIRGYLGTGLMGAVALGAIVLISFFSIYTFPASILMLLILFTFGTLGIVSISFQFGRWFLNRAEWNPKNPLISLGLGTFLIFSAIRIPFLGILFLLLASFTGFGAALSTRFGSGKQWTLSLLVEEEL